MSLLEIAQLATAVSLLVAAATFISTQVDRVRKSRQERVLRWQRVVIYNLIADGYSEFNQIRDSYVVRAQQFSEEIPKSDLQDSILMLIIMQLIADSLVKMTVENTYVPVVANSSFPNDQMMEMAKDQMLRAFNANKLTSDIYEILERESGKYTVDQLFRHMRPDPLGYSFDHFHAHIRRELSNNVVFAPTGLLWLRSRIPSQQKSP